MKKTIVLLGLLLIGNFVFAYDEDFINKEEKVQEHISNVAQKIMLSNKIDNKITFVYIAKPKGKTIDDPTVTKKKIIFYKDYFNCVENDDELAGFLSREIARAVKSASGEWKGFVSMTQVKAAPKKFEVFADKRAVNYMVNAGYNPLGLITYINKVGKAKGITKISHNTYTKRMAIIYEYIYFNYPYFIKYNEYLKNENYQNFLKNSVINREMLYEKIKLNLIEDLDYE